MLFHAVNNHPLLLSSFFGWFLNHPQIGLWLGCPLYCVYFEDSKLVMYSLYSILWSFQIAHGSGFYGTFIPDLPIHPGDVSYQPVLTPGGNIKVMDSDLFASIWDLEMVVSVPQDQSKHFNSANNSAGVWFQMATNGYRPTIGVQRHWGSQTFAAMPNLHSSADPSHEARPEQPTQPVPECQMTQKLFICWRCVFSVSQY